MKLIDIIIICILFIGIAMIYVFLWIMWPVLPILWTIGLISFSLVTLLVLYGIIKQIK